MLVLSRKVEEEIRIGDQITLRVLAIKDGQVKLGITAPREMRVYRSEIYEQVQRQNEAAARAEKSAVIEAAAELAKLRAPGTGTQNTKG
jgi:carbon storage regulator